MRTRRVNTFSKTVIPDRSVRNFTYPLSFSRRSTPPRMTPHPESISIAQARRLALAGAGLLAPRHLGLPERAGVRSAQARERCHRIVEHFGYLQGRALSAICGLIGRLTALWGRLTASWDFQWTPAGLVGSIAHRQAA